MICTTFMSMLGPVLISWIITVVHAGRTISEPSNAIMGARGLGRALVIVLVTMYVIFSFDGRLLSCEGAPSEQTESEVLGQTNLDRRGPSLR